MDSTTTKVYGYRWAVLGAFMLVNLAIQVLWISYAPVTGQAATLYGVSDLRIGFFSMLFMIAFVPLSIPVSWAIDTLGFRKSVGFGSSLMGVAGVLRGLAGPDYTLALIATVGLAASQPFMLNAWTKVPALWFPPRQRATAVGLVTLASLLGTALGMVLTPALAASVSIPTIQLYYGLFSAACALVFIVVARERPATPPSDDAGEARSLMLAGLRHAFTVPSFRRFLIISFVCLGVFNGISTWIEAIVRPRGFSPQEAGTLGAVILLSGVLGAVIIPAISDRRGKRRPFIILGVALCIPGLLGLAYAQSFLLLCLASAILGFFLTSVLPVGMQYVSEITRPTPEGTSNGLIQLFGQAAVVFVYLMEALRGKDGSFTIAILVASALLAMSALIAGTLRE
ncbi:MAG: MFS transporter [Spirochaetae bacterium HGW-Spirochaetae-7]|nr:MAG: MFS transporter [Spirochaetae bacterium HGW-Spirochaetae-7]